ncbi:hypothetical protein JG687_00019047 [Phytophthora cactorum]|uniref:FLYWCH-type domain-containing protein n=1 Tax=Phytophthora cactorum TaxID=29920 RepID=A0A8T1TN63_9STRA|nr:hypothetical protein JG687_00019047 [Phytophthora cactorum]
MSTRKVLDQSAAVQDSRYVTIIYLEGYQYTRSGISSRKTSYRCSYYRTGCKGKVDLITRTNKFMNFVGHTCERGDGTEVPDPTSDTSDQNTTTAVTTANPCMIIPQGGYQPPPFNSVVRIGPNHIDPVLLGRIENPPLSLVRNSTLQFLQFNCMSGYGPNDTPNRVIGWAHPDLIELLKHADSTIYVDTSLRRLPPGFEQCMTLVVYDKTSGFFVPAFYVLCTTRALASYRNALYFVVQSTRRKLRPQEIVCAFDNELYRALQLKFPNAVVKGSVFLFKKACQTRMEQLEISEETINVAMEKGVLDMLASIPPERVATAGIAWVKQQIKKKCSTAGILYAQDQWRSFWVYFRRVWISQFSPAMWNMHGLSNSIITRTNNPVEHFLTELENSFTAPDAGLKFFVATIERMARRHVAGLAGETTTLPSAVEMYSDVETSSDEGSFGGESDKDDSDDEVDFIKTEPLGGHVGISDEDENKQEAG